MIEMKDSEAQFHVLQSALRVCLLLPETELENIRNRAGDMYGFLDYLNYQNDQFWILLFCCDYKLLLYLLIYIFFFSF